MLYTALATARLAASLTFGYRLAPWSLDAIVQGMLATLREFGALDETTAASAPGVDERTVREMQLRRVRDLVARAHETAHYRRVLAQVGLDDVHSRLDWTAFARLPVTSKVALREAPGAFVHESSRPTLLTETTGTTGAPTLVHYSSRELRALTALAAISYLSHGHVLPDDVVQICSGPRALGTVILSAACARIGALAHVSGAIAPSAALSQLASARPLGGRAARVGVLSCYPSYLGQLVEEARRRDLGPRDFALERVITGGEIVTQGLRRRARETFGDVSIVETYALTETLPLGGVPCTHGHLHFEPAHGVVEVISLESGKQARPGELGTLVLTPLPPFRETTLLLRYDSEDLVRPVCAPLDCERRLQPCATSHTEGKLRSAIHTDAGTVCARPIREALEAVSDVPLPAHYAARPMAGGIALDVVVRNVERSTARRLHDALDEAGVPVRKLRLMSDVEHLPGRSPCRADLREPAYA